MYTRRVSRVLQTRDRYKLSSWCGPESAAHQPVLRRIRGTSIYIFTPCSVMYFTAPGCHGIGE